MLHEKNAKLSTLLSLGHEIELTSKNLAKRAEAISHSLRRPLPKPESVTAGAPPDSEDIESVLARTLLALVDARTELIRIEGIIGFAAAAPLGEAIGQ